MRPLILPRPPDVYDPAYMAQVVRAITLWCEQFGHAVELQVRFVDATELPSVTDLAILPVGAVYYDGDDLKRKT